MVPSDQFLVVSEHTKHPTGELANAIAALLGSRLTRLEVRANTCEVHIVFEDGTVTIAPRAAMKVTRI